MYCPMPSDNFIVKKSGTQAGIEPTTFGVRHFESTFTVLNFFQSMRLHTALVLTTMYNPLL